MVRKCYKKPELKLKDITHPKSRKAKQFSKKTHSIVRRGKSKLKHQMKINLLGEKMIYFKDHIGSNDSYTRAQLKEMIEVYLSRFEEELNQIQVKHSIGQRQRQQANREDVIKMTKEREYEEYTTGGFELPDLLDKAQVKMLKEWNGEIRYISCFKLRRFTKSFLESSKSNNSNTDENYGTNEMEEEESDEMEEDEAEGMQDDSDEMEDVANEKEHGKVDGLEKVGTSTVVKDSVNGEVKDVASEAEKKD